MTGAEGEGAAGIVGQDDLIDIVGWGDEAGPGPGIGPGPWFVLVPIGKSSGPGFLEEVLGQNGFGLNIAAFCQQAGACQQEKKGYPS